MEADSTWRPAGAADLLRRIDWGAVWTWVLGFGLVVLLGLEGGGYDPLVHDQVGIAVWWVLLTAVAVGALPRRRPGPLAWAAIGLLAALCAWTALSLIWTESIDRTWADLARILLYLGVFALAVFSRGRRGARRMVAAVGAGIAVVSLVALLSRLHPSWFPEADETARFLTTGRERLAYPLHYWNALAALIAIGLPAVLYVATCAKTTLVRPLAAAALPAMVLTAFLTLSRGGIAAAIVALIVFLALTSDRVPKVLTTLVAAAGSAILILAADSRDAFQHGLLNDTARSQGDEMVAFVLVVCLLVAAIQVAISYAMRPGRRPGWTRPSRGQGWAATGVGVLALLIALLAVDAPGRASDGWEEFKEAGGPGRGTARLTRFAGEGRYQLWEAAVDQNSSEPLIGTGSGTFEFWWTRHGERGVVRDTHNLYLQTLGELGVVGFALLVGLLLVILLGGGRLVFTAASPGRPQLAAALAGCAALFLTAVFDWMWQIPVLPVAMLLLASALVTAGPRRGRRQRGAFPGPIRAATALLGLAAIAAIAVPLAATSFLRESEGDFRSGDYGAALEAARSAENVMPGAAPPRLQQALVLEAAGDLTPAAAAARQAAEREETNWRNWLVLSRLEAARGRPAAAVAAYRRAASLNPNFSFFNR